MGIISNKCQTCLQPFRAPVTSSGPRKYCSSYCYGRSRVGVPNKSLSKKITKYCLQCDTEFKVSPSMTHVAHCSRACGAITQGEKISGENCHLWRGGIAYLNQGFRVSPAYKTWRLTTFKRDQYECQICGGLSQKLQAHHIKPFRKNKELSLDPNNGITLCAPCHKTVTWHEEEWESYFIFNLETFSKVVVLS